MTEDFTPRTYTFEGMRLERVNPPEYAAIATFRREDGDAARFTWKDKTFRAFKVGLHYAIPTSPDGKTLRFAGAETVGHIEDAQERQGLIAAHRASLAGLAAQKQRDKMLAADVDMEAVLRPLVPFAAQCKTWESQTAFECLVLSTLRRMRMEHR